MPLPQVFQVQVRCGGRRHTLPRRYSEFHALHKRVRRPMTLGGGHPGLYLPQAWICRSRGLPPHPPVARNLQGPPHLGVQSCRWELPSWQIKKRCKVPDFPSKRLPGWRTRGLEQQRLGLEAYIQVCVWVGGIWVPKFQVLEEGLGLSPGMCGQ